MQQVKQSIWKTGRFLTAFMVRGSFAIAPLLAFFVVPAAVAQIIPDNTLPTPSSNQTGCTLCAIEGGTQQGNYLFHSFTEFSVPTGGEAIFKNSDTIETIFSRVTGDTISDIDGVIRANGTADFFLLNPNGILFGPNAQLDIGGSFVATTADALQFGKQGVLTTSEPNNLPILTVAPSALLFSQESIGTIENQALVPTGIDTSGLAILTGLQVPDDQSLLLVGGDIWLNGGSLQAPGGQIELAGVATPGSINLTMTGSGPRLSPSEGLPFANILLSDNAVIDVMGDSAGEISLWGKTISLQQLSRILLDAPGDSRGKISLWGQTINLQEDSSINGTARSIGPGHDIVIKATETLQLTERSEISLANIILIDETDASTDDLTVDPQQSNARAEENVPVSGGNILITANSLVLNEGSQISIRDNFGKETGNLTIFASQLVNLDGDLTGLFTSDINSSGHAGDIYIETGHLRVANGAQISSGEASERGGDLTIMASESVDLLGTDGTATGLYSGPEIDLFGTGGGFQSGIGDPLQGMTTNSGNLTIQTARLRVQDGATISAVSIGDTPSEQGGSLIINASETVELLGTRRESVNTSSLQGFFGFPIEELTDIPIEDLLSLSVEELLNIPTQRLLELSPEEFLALSIDEISDISIGNLFDVLLDEPSSSLPDISELVPTDELDDTPIEEHLDNPAEELDNVLVEDFISVPIAELLSVPRELLDGSLETNTNRLPSGLFTSSLGLSDAGDISILTRHLSLQDGAQILASTLSSGAGGDINVIATDSVSVTGTSLDGRFSSALQTRSDLVESSDSSSFFQSNLESSENVAFRAEGDAGNLFVQTGQLYLQAGGQISVSTLADGDSGSLAIDATDSVAIVGISAINPELTSGLFAQVLPGATGNGGNINVIPGRLTIQNGAGIIVDNQSLGEAGTIEIVTDSLALKDNARISAVTQSSTGGDIKLQIQALLLLRDDSSISTNAGEAQAGGDGGNILIDAENGFIVSVLAENNDINANAFSGRGGNIVISTQGLFGIQPQVRSTPSSDITATSELGIDGTIQISNFNVEPSQGLVELPAELLGASQVLLQECNPQAVASPSQGEFFNSGRGGIAALDMLEAQDIVDDLRLPAEWADTTPITEAKEWFVSDGGEVVLTATPEVVRCQY